MKCACVEKLFPQVLSLAKRGKSQQQYFKPNFRTVWFQFFPSIVFLYLSFDRRDAFWCTVAWRKRSCLKSEFLVDFEISCSYDFRTNGCRLFCLTAHEIMDFRKKNCLHPNGHIHWVWEWNLLNHIYVQEYFSRQNSNSWFMNEKA